MSHSESSSIQTTQTRYDLVTGNAWTLVHEKPEPIIQAIVTSPPYWKQRKYTASSEEFGCGTLDQYVTQLADLFEGLKAWLTPTGAAWLNIGDSVIKGELQFVPQKAVLAIQARGWRILSEVIYSKTNSTPKPSPGRPARHHEHVFLLTPHSQHYYNDALMTEPAKYAGYVANRQKTAHDGRIQIVSRNHVVPERRALRTVWEGRTGWGGLRHPALMPRLMVERCVLSISAPGDCVLDPFSGLGSTGVVALEHHRQYLGWELNPQFVIDTRTRLDAICPPPEALYINRLPVVKPSDVITIVDGKIHRELPEVLSRASLFEA